MGGARDQRAPSIQPIRAVAAGGGTGLGWVHGSAPRGGAAELPQPPPYFFFAAARCSRASSRCSPRVNSSRLAQPRK